MDGIAGALLLLAILGIAAALAWVALQVVRQKKEMGNLVDDVNRQVVDPLVQTQGSVDQLTRTQLADTARVTSNVALVGGRADQLDAAGVGLGNVVGFPGATSGQSLWSQATTLAKPNVDLHLLSHTSALGGITVASKLDVSGGYFSADAGTGSVKVCGRQAAGVGGGAPTCTNFNTDDAGTTVTDGPATFNNTTQFSQGLYTSDVLLGTPAGAGFANGQFGLAPGPGGSGGAMVFGSKMAGQGLSVMEAGIDQNLNFVVNKIADNGTATPIVTITQAGTVTVTSSDTIKLEANNIDVSGNVLFRTKPLVATAAGNKPVAVTP